MNPVAIAIAAAAIVFVLAVTLGWAAPVAVVALLVGFLAVAWAMIFGM